MGPVPWVEQILARQRVQTPQTWASLSLRGINETTPVVLDFHFSAPDAGAADSLVRFLRAETPWEVATVSFNAGFMGRREWEVAGSTQRRTINLDLLIEWAEWMVVIGADHNCRFGQWGVADDG